MLRLLCSEGLGSKAIAARLGLSVTTVNHHIDLLIGELVLFSRGVLMIWAWQHPEAMRGEWVQSDLHAGRCTCQFCSLVEFPKAA